jgi:hypothetical protein
MGLPFLGELVAASRTAFTVFTRGLGVVGNPLHRFVTSAADAHCNLRGIPIGPRFPAWPLLEGGSSGLGSEESSQVVVSQPSSVIHSTQNVGRANGRVKSPPRKIPNFLCSRHRRQVAPSGEIITLA